MEPTTTPPTEAEPTRDVDDEDDEGEPRPPGMLIVAAIVALAVGGLAGFAIGFKVEQNRVKEDLKDRAAAAPPAVGARRAQPAGEVTAVSPDSVTIRNARGKNRVINLSTTTVVNTTAQGGPSDITTGSRVLVQGKAAADGSFDASEIIILPADSEFAPVE
jgi:hypothetical protein